VCSRGAERQPGPRRHRGDRPDVALCRRRLLL